MAAGDEVVGSEGVCRFESRPNGSTRVVLEVDGTAVSGLHILPHRIWIGRAIVAMDGICGVWTLEDQRMRGYSRRVLQYTVSHMKRGDAAVSMLYGIPDFYPKFGYSTAGPDQMLELRPPKSSIVLPEGWTERHARTDDLDRLAHIYHQEFAGRTGASLRPSGGDPWARLAKALESAEVEDQCRVAVAPSGEIEGYVWRAGWHWAVRASGRREPDALILGELAATSDLAAEVVLEIARHWTREAADSAGQPVKCALTGCAGDDWIGRAARRTGGTLLRRYTPTAESMICVLSPLKLLTSLAPELHGLIRVADLAPGTLNLEIDGAALCIEWDSSGPVVRCGPNGEQPDLRLTSMELGSLICGADAPGQLISPQAVATPHGEQLLHVFFPVRQQHMSLPDRY